MDLMGKSGIDHLIPLRFDFIKSFIFFSPPSFFRANPTTISIIVTTVEFSTSPQPPMNQHFLFGFPGCLHQLLVWMQIPPTHYLQHTYVHLYEWTDLSVSKVVLQLLYTLDPVERIRSLIGPLLRQARTPQDWVRAQLDVCVDPGLPLTKDQQQPIVKSRLGSISSWISGAKRLQTVWAVIAKVWFILVKFARTPPASCISHRLTCCLSSITAAVKPYP